MGLGGVERGVRNTASTHGLKKAKLHPCFSLPISIGGKEDVRYGSTDKDAGNTRDGGITTVSRPVMVVSRDETDVVQCQIYGFSAPSDG